MMDRGDVMTNTVRHLAPIFGPWKGNSTNQSFQDREGHGETSGYSMQQGQPQRPTQNSQTNYLCSGEHINPLYHFDDIRDAYGR